MKNRLIPILAFSTLALFSVISDAKDVLVKGYVKRDGTYVAPHYRTQPDNNPYNNYSTKGNINPYTGKTGTVSPYNDGSSGSESSDSADDN